MGVATSQGMYGSGNYGAGAGAPAPAPAAPVPAATAPAVVEGKEAEEEVAAAVAAAPKGALPEVKWEELDGMTKLGQGSFGVVHKARWRGTLVAVKVPMSQGEHRARGDARVCHCVAAQAFRDHRCCCHSQARTSVKKLSSCKRSRIIRTCCR